MTFLCGIGAFTAAIFHLLAHGCFKAFLFLSTGNVLASTHRRFDLPESTPKTASGGLFIWALALSAVPPLVVFSGAYRSLWLGQGFTHASLALWVVGLGTVFFTAMYLYKGFATVFHHDVTGAGPGERIAPSPASARLVLAIVAVSAAAIAALLWIWQWFAAFLSPALAMAPAPVAATNAGGAMSFWLMLPLSAAGLGLVAAHLQGKRGSTGEVPTWKKRLYVFFLNKGYFDELYDALLVRPSLTGARWMWDNIDRGIVDRLVLGLGSGSIGVARRLGRIDMAVDRQVDNVGTGSVSIARWLGRIVDTGGISKTVDGVGRGVDATGHAAKRMEPRTLQHHLLVVVLWLVAALAFFYMLAGSDT
jgi:NADH-quinone oxidoreductase subunit L